MDELPKEARALLALAKDGHDPPDGEARARVRAKLALALGASAAGAGASSAAPGGAGKALWGSWVHAKGWLAASVLSVGAVGTSIVLLQPAPARVAQHPVAARRAGPAAELAPAVEPPPSAAAPAASLAAESEPVAAAKPSGRPRSAALSRAGLAEETELLGRAARLLAQRDAAGARRLLAEHRGRFARSQLREERHGLSVLARCLEDPSSAAQQARSFIAAAPASVLVARIEKACGLGREE